ncbi:F0F1 ATP synthase subunit alpha [Rhodocista pekingensis]|uniref:ATP synthase subunit alpha n=1 Tax=Rhodocista pekingensis TaxID=201185 RepID=A0ABW2KUU9_9PROT
MTTLTGSLDRWLPEASQRAGTVPPGPRVEETGRIERVGDGVALVSGLPGARADEILLLPGGVPGLAMTLDRDTIGCVLLGDGVRLAAGGTVHGSGAIVRVPVGPGLLGRVVDPLGRPLDGGPPPRASRLDPVERPAPAIAERAEVTQPLHTGLTVVDAMFPIGRGQRELIIGDRATGKTALALDAMLAQRDGDVVCIYAAIAQKASSVREVVEALRAGGMLERSIVVVASPDAPPGLQWLAPYAAMTMAEFFRDSGGHALVVLDDLTKHAAIHRQIALLLRQPPGREAFPGDVFYLHSRLLERSAKLSDARGGGSLTALPVAETLAGNLSAYIPTNLISITDGQIVLDTKLFHEGQKPAVDVGRSVSRVGGKTQSRSLRPLAESLRLDYAQFAELEAFTRFGGMTDERTRRAVEHGRRLRSLLAQPRLAPLPLVAQVALLLALAEGLLDPLPLDRIPRFRADALAALADHGAIAARLATGEALDDSTRAALLATMRRLLPATPPAAAPATNGRPGE